MASIANVELADLTKKFLKTLYTEQLLILKNRYYGSYSPFNAEEYFNSRPDREKYVHGNILEELATRENVLNKPEKRKLRQEAAKRGR
jgi:hypothetical protein